MPPWSDTAASAQGCTARDCRPRALTASSPVGGATRAGVMVDAAQEFAQLQLRFVDQLQQRYEVIRPLIFFEDRTATQRAQETQRHPETVRALARRFRQQGMLGLLGEDQEVRPRGRARRVSEAVRQEIDRLKGLYTGFHYRELARIVFCKLGETVDHKTVQQLWEQSPAV